jgi:hypothetical protein
LHGAAGSSGPTGKCGPGAEAQRELLELYAALKRRSSTVLPAATGLRASATTGAEAQREFGSLTGPIRTSVRAGG